MASGPPPLAIAAAFTAAGIGAALAAGLVAWLFRKSMEKGFIVDWARAQALQKQWPRGSRPPAGSGAGTA